MEEISFFGRNGRNQMEEKWKKKGRNQMEESLPSLSAEML